MTSDDLRRLVAFLAAHFGRPEVDVLLEIARDGLPILARHTIACVDPEEGRRGFAIPGDGA